MVIYGILFGGMHPNSPDNICQVMIALPLKACLTALLCFRSDLRRGQESAQPDEERCPPTAPAVPRPHTPPVASPASRPCRSAHLRVSTRLLPAHVLSCCQPKCPRKSTTGWSVLKTWGAFHKAILALLSL